MESDVFHILNRGMHKQRIFLNTQDYLRFVYTLYKSNNKPGAIRSVLKSPSENLDQLPEQDKLVDILKWSLLPNHYHLLVREVVDGGAIEFTKRIGNSYTKYFNIKYKSSGYLFQSRAKILRPETDGHFLHLPYYVELNPAELIGEKSPQEKINFLESYRWSSFRNYAHNNPEFMKLISSKDMYGEIFEFEDSKSETYKKESMEWLKDWKSNKSL